MCKHGVKKLPYLLKHVPDQYKTLFLTATKMKKV